MIVSMKNVTDLKAGDKIKPLAAPGMSISELDGLVDRHGPGVFVRHSTVTDELDHPMIIASFGGTEFTISRWELVECADATPTEQRDNEIERLNERIKVLSDDSANSRVKIMDLKQALRIVNERLNEEAEKRDWCSEYDEILREVNDKIERDAGGVYQLQGLKREWKFSVQGTATVDWEEEVTVEASTEDEARSLLESDPSSYFDEYEAIDRQVRNWGYTDQNITDIDAV